MTALKWPLRDACSNNSGSARWSGRSCSARVAASSALTYVSTFPTQASRQQIAATTGQDAGIAILLGPITSIDTVGGYTVYKCFVTLTTIGAIWALLAATRLLRGEEDSGRWQLASSGGTRASRATVATLAGIGAAVAIVFAGTTLFTLLAGRNPDVGFAVGDSVVYGLSIAIAPAVFVGHRRVDITAGPLAPGRRRTRHGGVRHVLRGADDGGLEPLHAVAALVHTVRVDGADASVHRERSPSARASPSLRSPCSSSPPRLLASRRDAGEGVLADRDAAQARTFGLGSPVDLTLRLELPIIVAWFAGVAAAAVVLRDHRQGGNWLGARLDDGLARQLRRPGDLRAPVPRCRVLDDGGDRRAPSRQPDRRVGRRRDERPARERARAAGPAHAVVHRPVGDQRVRRS